MMLRGCQANRCAGFTLVEMLVVLALAGLISLLLLQGVGLAARGLTRLSAHAERLDERRGLEMLLRRALGSAAAIPVYDGEPGFVGHPTRLSFLSVVADGGAGLYRITLGLDPTHAPASVILSRRVAGRSAPPGGQSVLLGDIRSFAIDYFGAISPDADAAWHRDWEGMTHLPQLVRITLSTAANGEEPAIILRLSDAD